MANRSAFTVRRALLGATAVVTAIWFVVVLAWSDAPFALTFDDAYYYFAIARNIAAGHGSTFDQINLTNGYHPLWMLVSVVPFKLGLDDLTAARALLALQVVIGWGGTLAVTATIVARALDPREVPRNATIALTAIFVAVGLNPFLVKVVVNGLESGIAAPLYALVLLVATGRYTTARAARRRRGKAADPAADEEPLDGWVVGSARRWRWQVGALLALTFLARTDAAIMLGCLGLWCLAEARWGVARSSLTWGGAVGAIAELFALPAVTIAAYLAINALAFDSPLQVSGLIKRATPEGGSLVLLVVLVVAAGLAGWRGFRATHGAVPSRPPRFPQLGTIAARTGWFGAFSILVIAYYNTLQLQQWLWYYCPVAVYVVLLFLVAVTDMLGVALSAPTPAEARRGVVLVGAIFTVPLLLGLVLQARSFTDPTILSIQQANRDAGEWIRANVPEDAVLSSWDAGVVGYFAHRRVMNLDGVVNSKAFYDALQSSTAGPFLRCRNLGWVVNHGAQVDGRDPDIDSFVRALYGPDAAQRSEIVHRVPFRYSGTTNNGGFEQSGERELVVDLYRIPPDLVGPRPTDPC